jgi:hypothetical protein
MDATGYAHAQCHSVWVKFGIKLNVRGLILRRKPTADGARHRQGRARSSQAIEIYQFLLATAAYNMAREKRRDESTFPEFKHSVSQCFPC